MNSLQFLLTELADWFAWYEGSRGAVLSIVAVAAPTAVIAAKVSAAVYFRSLPQLGANGSGCKVASGLIQPTICFYRDEYPSLTTTSLPSDQEDSVARVDQSSVSVSTHLL